MQSSEITTYNSIAEAPSEIKEVVLNFHANQIRNSFYGYNLNMKTNLITMVIHFRTERGNIRGFFHAIGNYGFAFVHGQITKIC